MAMIKIMRERCTGCGLCIENCPCQAISLINKRAEINQRKCNRCQICLAICPRGAIVEMVAASIGDIKTIINELKHETEIVMSKIKRLERRNQNSRGE